MWWWKKKNKMEDGEVCTDPNCPDKDKPGHTHKK